MPTDRRHHVESMLMRESLLDKQVMSSTETPVVPMLPFCHVVKVGGRSILDNGKKATYPLVEALAAALTNFKLVIGTGAVPILPPIRGLDSLGPADGVHLLHTMGDTFAVMRTLTEASPARAQAVTGAGSPREVRAAG